MTARMLGKNTRVGTGRDRVRRNKRRETRAVRREIAEAVHDRR